MSGNTYPIPLVYVSDVVYTILPSEVPGTTDISTHFLGGAPNTTYPPNFYLFRGATLTTARSFPFLLKVRALWSTTPLSLPSIIGCSFETTAVPVPVGGIYETLDATDPATIWPGTAWEALGVGRTTVGAGGSYTAGAIGGSNVLATGQLLSHDHLYVANGYFAVTAGTAASAVQWGNHGGLTTGVRTGTTGSAQPHEHPYIVVYRWKRLPNTGPVAQFNLTEITKLLKEIKEHLGI
jgi:hypothetical protein